MSNKNIASAHCTATVLDLAYVQYSVQWQKIGNMQSSAGAILTVISIIASLMIGVISQVTDINTVLTSLGVFAYSFYISFIFSFIYLIISAIFVYKVVKMKSIKVLKFPTQLNDQILNEIYPQISDKTDDIDSIALCVDTNVLLKLNEEIEKVNSLLEKNQVSYNKCVKSSFLSLICCFLALGHTIIPLFNNNIFYRSTVGILGYICIFGLFFVFYHGRKNEI